MGKACCAVGCTNRFTKGTGVSFYRFPKDPARRALWIAAVGRKNWTPNKYSWICSAHFVSGKKSDDPLSPEYVPTLFAHTGSPAKRKAGDMSRYQRSQAAKRRKIDAEPGSSCSTDEEESDSEIGAQKCSTMTDLSGDDVLKLQDECQLLGAENHRLKDSADCLTEASFQNNDAKVKFYTGLPSFATLISVFTFVSAHVITAPQASLTTFQQFVMVLMKLRLNLANQDLAYRFGVHQASVSRNFRKWIDVMYRRLRPLIIWPTREELLKTMPVAFRKSFRRCVVIIDCFEVFCERPANLKA